LIAEFTNLLLTAGTRKNNVLLVELLWLVAQVTQFFRRIFGEGWDRVMRRKPRWKMDSPWKSGA